MPLCVGAGWIPQRLVFLSGSSSVFMNCTIQNLIRSRILFMLPGHFGNIKPNFLLHIYGRLAASTDKHLSCLMSKPTICISKNKDADQLRGKREADQHLCFSYKDSTLPLLLKICSFSHETAHLLLLSVFCFHRLNPLLHLSPVFRVFCLFF